MHVVGMAIKEEVIMYFPVQPVLLDIRWTLMTCYRFEFGLTQHHVQEANSIYQKAIYSPFIFCGL
jgi:hypothetical protein